MLARDSGFERLRLPKRRRITSLGLIRDRGPATGLKTVKAAALSEQHLGKRIPLEQIAKREILPSTSRLLCRPSRFSLAGRILRSISMVRARR